MKTYFTKFATVAALAAGMAFAQTSSPVAPVPGAGKSGARAGAGVRRRLLQALNLTDAQKQQAKAIFQQNRQNVQPISQQVKQNRQALSAAVKSNDTAQIQTLSAQRGTLQGQMLANRSESMAKFYAILTPEQRAKADQIQQRIQQRMQQRKAALKG